MRYNIHLIAVGLVVLAVWLCLKGAELSSVEVGIPPTVAETQHNTPAPAPGQEIASIKTQPYEGEEKTQDENVLTMTAIFGVCVNSEGEALEGAIVRSLHQHGEHGIEGKVVATTNELGEFQFVLPHGTKSAGLMLHLEHLSADRSKLLLEPHLMVEVKGGEMKNLGKVVLGLSSLPHGAATKATLEGRVVDQNGVHLPMVELHIYPRGLGKPLTVWTNRYGEFTVSGLSIWGKDFPSFMVTTAGASITQAIQKFRPEHALLSVKPLEHNFRGGPGAVEHITFEALSGAPPQMVSYAKFNVPDFESHEWLLLGRNGEVLSDGSTVFGGQAEVDFELAELQEFMPLTVELTDHVPDVVVHLPVELQGGGMKVGPMQNRIACQPLRGLLVDKFGNPLADGVVAINRTLRIGFGRKNYRELRTGPSGEFEVLLPPGHYQVVGVREESRLAQWAFNNNPSKGITLGPGGAEIRLTVW